MHMEKNLKVKTSIKAGQSANTGTGGTTGTRVTVDQGPGWAVYAETGKLYAIDGGVFYDIKAQVTGY